MTLIYDRDGQDEIIEPFVIKINGVEFTIKDLPVKEYDRITALPDLAEQLAEFAGVERSAIENISIRKVTAALKIVSQEIRAPLEKEYYPKNSRASELKKSM